MKSTIQYVAVAAMAMLVTSCSDDDNNAQPNTFGDTEIYFDNGVAGDALVLGSNYTNSNGETLKIERLNYIVSNFRLIDENGYEFTYPKEDSYFVISEEAEDMLMVHLENIPAGNYKQIKFGIGVDSQRYLQGETAQQSFWNLASLHDLIWTWSTGYKFILFEGTFTTPQATGEKGFMVHQGSNTATDNYREVTLNLPTTARVRPGEMPSIHIKSDVNVLLDGTNKISLFANLNPAGTSAGIMGGENLIKIAANSLSMFTVDHVHNGADAPH